MAGQEPTAPTAPTAPDDADDLTKRIAALGGKVIARRAEGDHAAANEAEVERDALRRELAALRVADRSSQDV